LSSGTEIVLYTGQCVGSVLEPLVLSETLLDCSKIVSAVILLHGDVDWERSRSGAERNDTHVYVRHSGPVNGRGYSLPVLLLEREEESSDRSLVLVVDDVTPHSAKPRGDVKHGGGVVDTHLSDEQGLSGLAREAVHSGETLRGIAAPQVAEVEATVSSVGSDDVKGDGLDDTVVVRGVVDESDSDGDIAVPLLHLVCSCVAYKAVDSGGVSGVSGPELKFVSESVHEKGGVVSDLVDEVSDVQLDPVVRKLVDLCRVGVEGENNLEIVRLSEVHEGNVVRALDTGLVVLGVGIDGGLCDGVCVVYSDRVGAELLKHGEISLPNAIPPALRRPRGVNSPIEIVFTQTSRELDDI